MKKLLFISLLFTSLFSCRKYVPAQSGLLTTIETAPCVYRLPAMVYVVDRNMVANKGNNVLWVCSGSRLKENGGRSIIFLESGAELVSKGGANIVYAKSGAKIDSFGGGDMFYYQPGVEFGKIWGGGEMYVECANMIFDYSLVTEQGCR